MAVNVKTACKDISELNPIVQIMYKRAIVLIKKNNITPFLVETYRPKLRQYYLYAQGRTITQCVNSKMPHKYAKLYARKGTIVTWTLKSIHISKCALDLVPQRDGKIIWNSSDFETKKLISIMEKVGFEAGANWKFSPDSPHFQVAGISSTKTYLSKSNTNFYVTNVVQKCLKSAGFYKGYLVDGVWGKDTNNAIKKWKKSVGLKSTAILGKKALPKLLAYVK